MYDARHKNKGHHMTQQWKNIDGHVGYTVSNWGRVKKNGVLLNQVHTVEGYARVKLSDKKMYYVHRLVALTFIGKDPSIKGVIRYVVDHKDDNPRNNNVKNLNWITNGDNMRKAHRQRGPGRRLPADRRAVLVERIIQNESSTAEICAEFGVSAPTVRHIRNGRSKEKLNIQPRYGANRTKKRTNHAARKTRTS